MKSTNTHGILLKKTLLANDDAFLEFLTSDFGRICLCVKRFGKSRKKAGEIDFFRLLELEIFEGRHSKSLRGAITVSIFPAFGNKLELLEKGFEWLDRLRKVLPEEKIVQNFFSEMVSFLSEVSYEEIDKFDTFFRVRILRFLGVLPRFDTTRGEIYLDPQYFRFSNSPFSNSQKLTNRNRQIVEFMRRSNFLEFLEKKEKLNNENFSEIQNVLRTIEEFH